MKTKKLNWYDQPDDFILWAYSFSYGENKIFSDVVRVLDLKECLPVTEWHLVDIEMLKSDLFNIDIKK